MPVNVALGHLSNAFLIAALVIYSLSVFAFSGNFAFGRPRRAAAARGQEEARERATALATVGAAAGAAAPESTVSEAPEAPGAPGGPAVSAAGGPAAGGPAAGGS